KCPTMLTRKVTPTRSTHTKIRVTATRKTKDTPTRTMVMLTRKAAIAAMAVMPPRKRPMGTVTRKRAMGTVTVTRRAMAMMLATATDGAWRMFRCQLACSY
ncbi:unnamed protein product, partial [Polarella glacialis]